MIIETGRFGQLNVGDDEQIFITHGILGFPEHQKFCLVDPGDETIMLWLQSLHHPDIAFPLLEPKVFKMDYYVRLSSSELRELHLDSVSQSAVFSILTIPDDVTKMTANLKAPLVINLAEKIAKQVVLQENEFNIQHPMFKELRAQLVTLRSQQKRELNPEPVEIIRSVMAVKDIPISSAIRSLHAP